MAFFHSLYLLRSRFRYMYMYPGYVAVFDETPSSIRSFLSFFPPFIGSPTHSLTHPPVLESNPENHTDHLQIIQVRNFLRRNDLLQYPAQTLDLRRIVSKK